MLLRDDNGFYCGDCKGTLDTTNNCTCWDRNLKAARVAASLDASRVVDNAGYHGVVRKDRP